MKLYRIRFRGRVLGSLGCYTEFVEKEVLAETEQEARLKAYETHERIFGGDAGVRAEVISPQQKSPPPPPSSRK